jgi:hypothetical protein
MGAGPSGWDDPANLDEIIDVVPAERSYRVAVAPIPRGKGRDWRPAGVLAAVALAALAVVALGDFRPGPAPTPPPSAAAVASTAPSPTDLPTDPPSFTVYDPTPAPTLGPDWPTRIDLPVVHVPADQVRSILTPTDGSATPAPSTVPAGQPVGPFLYGYAPAPGSSLSVQDFGGGAERYIKLPLKRGEVPSGTLSDGTWLAEMARVDGAECKAKQPWRLLAGRLGADGLLATPGALVEVAHGVGTGRKPAGQDGCLVAMPVGDALADGMLSWSTEGAGGKGGVVHVLRLVDGATWRFDTSGTVVQLAVTSSAVAWLDASNVLSLWYGTPGNGDQSLKWRAMEADLGGPATAAHVVDVGAQNADWNGGLALDGTAVVVSLAPRDGSGARVVRVDASGSTTIDDGSASHQCSAMAAERGVVLLACSWLGISLPGPDPSSTMALTLPAIWTAADGLRVVAIDDTALVGSWPNSVGTDLVVFADGQGFSAVPLSALVAP